MVTKGLGQILNPKVYWKLSLSDFKEAFQFQGNYRNMAPVDREAALKSDYELITADKPKAEKAEK